jgi:predicted thioesterase
VARDALVRETKTSWRPRPSTGAYTDRGIGNDRTEVSMRAIPLGARGSFALVVAPEHLANRFKDATLPEVLSTPVMIMAMENAALNAVKPYFAAGESAVGTHVDVRHLAATPVGRHVVAFAEVTAVTGRHIEFAVHAMDGPEIIGRGTHERALVDLATFAERLAAKSHAAG